MLRGTAVLGRRALALLFVAGVVACADRPPVELSTQYSPPANAQQPSRAPAKGQSCLVHLGEIRDLRSDPQDMGGSLGRDVRAPDSAGWVRSGLESLGESGIRFIDQSMPGELNVDVDLLKAYVMNVTGTTRSASVVLRARYSRDGEALKEQTYRGAKNGLNWADGEGEIQYSLNAALAVALADIRRDLVALCASKADSAAP